MTSLPIAYLSSEVSPFAKTGGLADVAEALPRALAGKGHDVRGFCPLYAAIDTQRYALVPTDVGEVGIELLGDRVPFALYQSTLPSSTVPFYFVHCPRFFGRDDLYTTDADEPLRFLFFCRAVLESCQRLRFAPAILHANDWQGALVPLLKNTLYAWDELFAKTRTLLTIHNIGYQGVFSADVLDAIGVEDRGLFDRADTAAGVVNFLKTGLLHADALSTVSPTYAREIQMPEHGFGLDPILRRRAGDLVGILNGVDYGQWSPREDSHIQYRYSRKSLWRKRKNKEVLLSRIGLPYSETVPLVGMVTRLFQQKGIELLYEALPPILERKEMELVVLGSGEARYEAFFASLQTRFPHEVSFTRAFDNELAHWIEAGADMFLMPSRYEPCGLNQMYSLAYGTVPIVRRTGGLADSVRLFDPETSEGTGIVFDHFTPEGAAWALETALALYRDPGTWWHIVVNGMAEDFSWERQAEQYVAIYRRLLIN